MFSFTPHSLLFVQKDLEEILFTTEGAEHTEKMIKNMFYLLCLLCVARSASVYSVVRMFCRRGFMPRIFLRCEVRASGYELRAYNLELTSWAKQTRAQSNLIVAYSLQL